jgi:hypothetical protein
MMLEVIIKLSMKAYFNRDLNGPGTDFRLAERTPDN